MLVRSLAVLALCLLAASAEAVTVAPTLTITVDGNPVATTNVFKPDPDGDGWVIENWQWGGPTQGAWFSLNGELNPDPNLVYAAAVIDFGAPSVFGFIFGLPIVATAAPGVVSHNHSSSTT